MAEKRTTVSRTIDAPAERVWEILADVGTWGEWNPTIISIEGESRVGTKVTLVSTLNPKRTFSLGVDEVEPPRRMVWSDGMPLGLFTGTRTYTVEAADDGAVFTMTEEYSGLMAPMIMRSIPDLGESFAHFADGLQAAAESVQ